VVKKVNKKKALYITATYLLVTVLLVPMILFVGSYIIFAPYFSATFQQYVSYVNLIFVPAMLIGGLLLVGYLLFYGYKRVT